MQKKDANDGDDEASGTSGDEVLSDPGSRESDGKLKSPTHTQGYGPGKILEKSQYPSDPSTDSSDQYYSSDEGAPLIEEKKPARSGKKGPAHDAFSHFRQQVERPGEEPRAAWHVVFLVKGLAAPGRALRRLRFILLGTDNAAFFWGSVISLGWFIVMWYIYSLPTGLTLGICCMVSFFLPLAMGISRPFRAYVFLVMPTVTGQYGRSLLIICCYSILLKGPMVNYTNNIRVYQDSIQCAKEQAHNATVEQLSKMTLPDEGVFGALKRLQANVQKMCLNIKMMYEKLLESLKKMNDFIEKADDWLEKFRNLCKRLTSIPYRICKDHFVILESWICKHFEDMSYPCRAITKLKNYIKKKVLEKMKSQFEETKAKLWEMNMTTVHRMELNKTVTKTNKQIAADIKKEMTYYTSYFDQFGFWMDVLYFLILVITIMRATKYHKKFLKLIEYDNRYITKRLYEMDEKRYNEGRETLLPLKRKEKKKYMKPGRPCPTKRETRQIITMIIMTTFIVANIGFYLLADYSLYSCLNLISDYGSVKVVLPESPSSKIAVSGSGGLASFYRELAGELNKFDTAASPPTYLNACMPKPFPPDYEDYKLILGMVLSVYFLILADVYSRRFCHVIMANFYPARAKVRSQWLYHRILRLRAGYGKRGRRNVKKGKEKLMFRARQLVRKLVKMCPCIKLMMRVFGMKFLFCFACGLMFNETQTEKYKRCQSYGCQGIYCVECFADLQNICAMCSQPIDYGDLSDISEEVDSSGEEGLSIVQLQAALNARFPNMFAPNVDLVGISRWPHELQNMGVPSRL